MDTTLTVNNKMSGRHKLEILWDMLEAVNAAVERKRNGEEAAPNQQFKTWDKELADLDFVRCSLDIRKQLRNVWNILRKRIAYYYNMFPE